MTATDFKTLRKSLFKSQKAAAEELGVSECAVAYWETGRRPVPEIAARFLVWLKKFMA